MSDGGKGSSARPFSVSYKDYNDRWDMIFGGDKEDKEDKEDLEKVIDTTED